jgi:hypothetical protein
MLGETMLELPEALRRWWGENPGRKKPPGYPVAPGYPKGEFGGVKLPDLQGVMGYGEKGYSVMPDAPPPTPMGAPQAAPAQPAAPVQGFDPQWAELEKDRMAREDMVLEGSMGLTGLDDERALLDQQMAFADELRNKELTGGRQAGRTFVADSPLEALAVSVNKYRGNKQRNETMKGIEGVNAKRKTAIQAIQEALRNRKGKKAPEEDSPQDGGVGFGY